MAVTAVTKDPATATVTLHAEFAAAPAVVWDLFADPRKLERWWGPPSYPATVVDHDLTPGGRVHYFMTGPDGQTTRGWWRVLEVDSPRHLLFEDGFADADGNPDRTLPTMIVTLALGQHEGFTRLGLKTAFPSQQAMAELDEMGMTEGMTAAMGQMDSLLGPGPA